MDALQDPTLCGPVFSLGLFFWCIPCSIGDCLYEYQSVLSNFNIEQYLFILLELRCDIVLGDTPVIVVADEGDTETKLHGYRDANDVRNSFFAQPIVDGTVPPLQVCRRCTCIAVAIQ